MFLLPIPGAPQVGDSGRHQQLKPGLGMTEITSLADPQLRQPTQPVLDHQVLPQMGTTGC